MRRFLKFASVAAAAAIVTACNPPTQATQQTACNCQGTVTTANPGAETQRFVAPGGEMHHRHHHRTHYATNSDDSNGTREHHRHSERAYVRSYYDKASYDYHSSSHVYREDGDTDSGYASSSSGYSDGFVDASDHNNRWQDGYGRWHNRAALGAKATHTRLDPYHGYDIDCPNGPRHRH